MTISGSRPLLSPSLQETPKHYNFDIKVKKEYYDEEPISHSDSSFYTVNNNNIKPETNFNNQHHIENTNNSRRDHKMLATHPRLPVHLEYLQPHITVRI